MRVKITKLDGASFNQWHPLWVGYLKFYNIEMNDQQINQTWEKIVKIEQTDIFGYGILLDNSMIGFTHLNSLTSTWSEKPYCYLQDLYISPLYRNQGFARKLIEHCYDMCKGEYAQIYWITDESNQAAQNLYDQIAEKTGFIQYKKSL